MAYQMAATSVTLNDLAGRLPVAGFFQMQTVDSVEHLCSIWHDFN